MTHVSLWMRDLDAAGDVTIQIVEVDEHLRPDHTKVMAHVVVNHADLFVSEILDRPLKIAIPPCYLEGGHHYGLLVHSTGNHAFYVIQEVDFAIYGYIPGTFWYWETTGVWVAAVQQCAPFMQIHMAQFLQNRYEIQMQPAQLSGGMSGIRVLAAAHAPPGTKLAWEVQNGGTWIPLDPATNNALSGNPALLPLRAVFTGTRDLMPAIDLTQTELEVTSVSTSLQHWSKARSLTSPTTSITVDYYMTGWDDVHHTWDCRIEIGGVTGGAGTLTKTPDPQNPSKMQLHYAFTVSSTSAYTIKTVGGTSAGYGFPVASERWDHSF